MSPTTAAGPPATGAASGAGITPRSATRGHSGRNETFASLLAALGVTPARQEPVHREPSGEHKGRHREEPVRQAVGETSVDAVRATLPLRESPAPAPEALPQQRQTGQSRPTEPAAVVQAAASRGGNARAETGSHAPAPGAAGPPTPAAAAVVADDEGGDPRHRGGHGAGEPPALVEAPVASSRSSEVRHSSRPNLGVLRPEEPRAGTHAPGAGDEPAPSQPPAGLSDPTPRSATGAQAPPRIALVRRAASPTRSTGRRQADHATTGPAADGPATTTTTGAGSTSPPLPGPTAVPGGGNGLTPSSSSALPVLPTLDVGQASAVLARLSTAGPGSHVVAVDLNPPGLGTVLARVQVSDSQLVVVLSPKEATVAQALAQNLADLGHQLGLTAGHRTLTLRVVDPEPGPRERDGSGPREHPDRGREGTARGEGPEHDVSPDTDPSVPPTMDLRL